MRSTVFIVLFSLIIKVCPSQGVLDSLRELAENAPNDKLRVDHLNSLANELFDYDLEESGKISDQAIQLGKAINYPFGQGWALIHKGIYFWLAGKPHEAIAIQQEAKKIADELNNPGLQAYVKLQNGKAYRDIGLYDSALNNFLRAESYQKQDPRSNPYAMSMIYTALGRHYELTESPDQAIVYYQKALEIREQMKVKQLIAYSWVDVGDAYRIMFNMSKARECYEKALGINPTDIWLQAAYSYSMGMLYFREGDFEIALTHLNKVLKTYEDYKGKHTLASTMIQIAEILKEKGLYDISTEYLYQALKITEESDYRLLSGEAHYELARVAYRANRLNDAKESILRSKKIFSSIGNELRVGGCFNVLGLIFMKAQQYDSSLINHEKGLYIRKKFQNKVAISSSLFNTGDLYLTWGNPDKALPYFIEGLKIDEEIGDKYGISVYQNRIGKIYSAYNEFDKAETYLKYSLDLAISIKASDLLIDAYGAYSEFYEKRGDLRKALEYRKLYEQVNDSLYNRSSAENQSAYRALYELEDKEKRIALLNKDHLIQADQIRKRNLILYWVISVSIILMIVIYLFYRYSLRLKKLNWEIRERNEEIQTQSEELQEANDTLVQLNGEITRQQEEIKSQTRELQFSNEAIARINEGLEKIVGQRTIDLRKAYQELDTFFYRSSHDFRRPLTTLMGLCEVAKMSVKDHNAIELFDKVNTTAINLDKMLMKLQSISDVGSHQLVHKEVLLKQIIDGELDAKKNFIQNKQIHVQVDVNLNDVFISYPVLVKIIIENLIENAIDFSTPNNPKLGVAAFNQNGSVIIEVKDNGEGIKDEIMPQIFEMFFRGTVRSSGNGLGLYIARKAAQKADGKITFKNNPDGGTTFTVEIPNNINI